MTTARPFAVRAVVLAALATGVAAQSSSREGATTPWIPDQGDGTFINPVLHADYSDPDVIRVGEDYYMTASSFTCAPGLPILHSRDMVNWRIAGHALRRQVPEDVFSKPQHGKGCWAPALRYRDGLFRIYYPDPDFGIYLVTARDPRGPWSAPVLVKAGKGLIDPCPLWDDDGRVWLVHAWARSRAGFANRLTLVELNADGTKPLDEGRTIVDGDAIGVTTLEGPKFYKRNGEYWIFAPAGGVRNGYQMAFRSAKVDGPYAHRVVLEQGSTDINGPHQGAWVETPKGEHWFFHFQDMDAYGRVVHLQPLAWRADGWPVMGEDEDGDGRGTPLRRVRLPLPRGRDAERFGPATSDEFAASSLGLQWQWQANPREEFSSLIDRPGVLRLRSLPMGSANLWTAPHVVLQKFPAKSFEVMTSLEFTPRSKGESAGLIVFGLDYAWIGLERTADGTNALVARVAKDAKDGRPEIETARRTFPPDRVVLRLVVGLDGTCRFAWSRDGVSFEAFGDPFKSRQGQWVGARFGLFASSADAPAPATPDVPRGHADWDYVRVTGTRPAGDRLER